jgi:hypothetical protein
VLDILSKPTDIKRRRISKYLDMYASIQLSKNESLSPVIHKDGGKVINVKAELSKRKLGQSQMYFTSAIEQEMAS